MSTIHDTADHETEASVVATIAEKAADPYLLDSNTTAEGLIAFTAAAGVEEHVLDLERYAERPRRKRGSVTVHEHESLSAYVNSHKIAGTALYADERSRSITALLNGHQPESGDDESTGDPGWGDHRANLQLRHSQEWDAWAALNGRLVSQVQLAEHFQDNYVDIVDPDHATMLELAQTFHATSDVAFKSQHRLSDGQTQLRYEETNQATAGAKGDLEIPAEFTLSLRVFDGTVSVEVKARFRHRLRQGELVLGYQLIRPDDAVREAFEEILADVETATGITAYRGVAPAALS